MSVHPELQERASEYAKLCKIELILKTPLGFGHDGTVWKSNRRTAVKALLREDNYRNELRCYQRFSDEKVTNIYGFAVPQLIGHDDALKIIEMKIVTPPYILDFAKVWIDATPDYPPETWQEYYSSLQERFGERTGEVRKLLSALQFHYSIWYADPKPGNIQFEIESDPE